jgi:thiopeptide-type bacteriocin biosynthesis protein
VNQPAVPGVTEQAVLAVLAGTPIAVAAAQTGTKATDLADAVAAYQAAGRAALATHNRSWYQVHVAFTDWHTAEKVTATHLHPAIRHAETSGVIDSWWYIRKAPHWRLRFHTTPNGHTRVEDAIGGVLNDAVDQDLIRNWRPSVYEPETIAFGGPAGMAAAHRLFHADSSNILDYLHPNEPTPHRKLGSAEMSLLLCAALMRAADQEWHEQGDIWHRIAQMRPLPPDTPPDGPRDLAEPVRHLLTLDTSPTNRLFDTNQPLIVAQSWFGAFTEAGRTLAEAHRTGLLERGLRDVLAYHVIFHWNRLGLPTTTQTTLARTATTTILGTTKRPPAENG